MHEKTLLKLSTNQTGMHYTPKHKLKYSVKIFFRIRQVMEEKTDNRLRNSKLRNVRRRLFSESHDNETNEQQQRDRISEEEKWRTQQLKQDMERAQKRWNFDFVHEVPLPGRYEWKRTDNQGNEISDSSEETNERTQNAQEGCTEEGNNAENSYDNSIDAIGKIKQAKS